MTANLGREWMFLETLYRIYSIPGYNIAHIDVGAKLCEENNIRSQDVDRIEAVVNWLETQYPSPAFPNQREDIGEPRPGSTRYYAAYGVVKRGFPMLPGDPDPPEVLELMKRVTIIPSHEMTLFGPRIRSLQRMEKLHEAGDGARVYLGFQRKSPAHSRRHPRSAHTCCAVRRNSCDVPRSGSPGSGRQANPACIEEGLRFAKSATLCALATRKSTGREEDTRMKACLVVLALGFAMPAWFLSDAKAQQNGRGASSSSPYPVVQGKTYKFEKIADGVYLATGGAGSNDIVIVNEADVMIVDDGSTPTAARTLLNDVKLVTDRPVRYVVNTHFHYDHTDGNSVFPSNVDIIAHEYVRTAILTFHVINREPYRTSQGTRVPRLIDTLKQQIADEKDASKKAALEKQLAAAQTSLDQLKEIKPTPPNVTYTSKMVLYKGQREIQLLFLGRGHTGGDTIVFCRRNELSAPGI